MRKTFFAVLFFVLFVLHIGAENDSIAGRAYSGEFGGHPMTIEFINDTEASFDWWDEGRGLEYEYDAESGIVKAWVTSRPEPKEFEAKIDGDSLQLISIWIADEQIVLKYANGNFKSLVMSKIQQLKEKNPSMMKAIGWFIILLPILIYISALLLSVCTQCIIVYKWIDVMLLLITLGLGWYFSGELKERFFIVCIPFAISLIVSVYANLGNSVPKVILYSIVSILSKFILLFVVFFLIFALIYAATSGEKDGRYKDGTKDNKRTTYIELALLLISGLFVPLIKWKGKTIAE